ncbi:MAG: ParA family protein [Firmicutes bacterium]|nr:ParA family protein [Bacillota bacterium]
MRVVAIANQKGGVGKTTTNINLSAILAESGKKVLTIDSDPQGNTTSGLGIEKESLEKTFYNLIIGEAGFDDVKIKIDGFECFDLLPSNNDLYGTEVELLGFDNREYLLKKIIEKVKDRYDYITIDCPPSVNILTLNALTAAGSVIVPLQCEYYALEGLTQLMHTIKLVQKKMNKDLKIEGVVFTMYDARTNLSMQVVEEVKKYLSGDVYKSIIPRNVKLSEAPSHGMPINLYDNKSKGAEAYRMLAEEFIERECED